MDDTEDYEVGGAGSGGDSDWSDLWAESNTGARGKKASPRPSSSSSSSANRPKRQKAAKVKYFQDEEEEDDDALIIEDSN